MPLTTNQCLRSSMWLPAATSLPKRRTKPLQSTAASRLRPTTKQQSSSLNSSWPRSLPLPSCTQSLRAHPCSLQHVQRRLTTRSSRRATAATAWPLRAMVVIVPPRPVGVCRSARLSSNVRPRQSCRAMRRSPAARPCACRACAPTLKPEPSSACCGWRVAPACCAEQSVTGVLCLPPLRATPAPRRASEGRACHAQSAARTVRRRTPRFGHAARELATRTRRSSRTSAVVRSRA